MDGLLDVVVLCIGLSQKFVSFALSWLVVRLRCDVKELFTLFNGCYKVAFHLMNKSELLMALSDFILQILLNGDLEALVEKLCAHFEKTFALSSIIHVLLCRVLSALDHIQVLIGNLLVHTNQVIRDVLHNLGQTTFLSLVECRLQVILGFKFIENILFSLTETLVRLGLTFDVIELNGSVKAPVVEVRGSLIVVIFLEHLCHFQISAEAQVSVPVTPSLFAL